MRRVVVLACLSLGACATLRPVPARVDGSVQAAIVEDLHAEPRAALHAWLAVLGSTRDAQLVDLALGRLDKLLEEGITDRAALRTLTVPDGARASLAWLRARDASLAGDEVGAVALRREAGCGLPWQAGAPLGALSRLDLAKPLDDALFVAKGRAVTRLHDCKVLVVTSDGRPGAVPLGVELDSKRPTIARLAVDSWEPYRVWLDGVATAMPDPRASTVRRRVLRVEVPAGRHRLAVVVSAPLGRVDVALELVTDATVGPASGSRFAGTEARLSFQTVPRPVGPLADYLDGAIALRDGDVVRGRRAAQRLASGTAVDLELAAEITSSDPTVPSRIARDRGRRLLERVLALDPNATRARNTLGRLALDQDRDRDALELSRAPDLTNAVAASLAAAALRARDRDPEVRALLDRVRDDGQCDLLDQLSIDDRQRHRPIDLARAEKIARCWPGSRRFADALKEVGQLDRAIDEYRRVVSIDPASESLRSSLADALTERDLLDDAIPVLRDLVETAPRTPTYRVRLVDSLVAAGRGTEADRVLRDGLALAPESAELQGAARARADEHGRPYAIDRVDGRQVIAAFEAAHERYEGPAVFVLDRTVTRVFPTGGQRTITHDIVKVLTKEGIDRWGEWTLPDNAELLGLCAWKPDGSRLEPEQIAEKDGISLPGLAVGDYVEVEYVERPGPTAAFEHGFLAERFFFSSFDAPLDRSEYVLVTPHDWPIELDLRNGPPPMTLSVRDDPDGRVDLRTFAARRCEQRLAEPSSAPGPEYLPSVRASAHVSIAAWRDYLRDLSFATHQRDPALDALAKSVTAGARSDRERFERLDRWVRRNIKQGGGIEETATYVLARREGSRATLLYALAEAAELPARLLLARSRRAAQIDVELEGYDQLLVEVAGVVDDPRSRHGRPGELQPQLRGASALTLDGSAQTLTLPAASADRRALTVAMSLAADGSGEVSVEERLMGWPAVEWRDSLSTLAPDRVRAQFEQRSLAAFFPGATLKNLSWEAEDDDDRPFVVRYSLTAPGLAHREGGALELPVPFAAELSRRYATGEARQSTILVDEVALTTLDLRVTPFPGAKVWPAPSAIRDDKVGRFSLRANMEGAVLAVHESFFMPMQRLSLADAPELLRWSDAVDRAEAAAARVTRP